MRPSEHAPLSRCFLAAVTVLVGTDLLAWAVSSHAGLVSADASGLAAFLVWIVVLVWLSATLVVRVKRGFRTAALVSAASYGTANVVLVVVGALWTPGLYQIDHDRRLFVVETSISYLISAVCAGFLAAITALAVVKGLRASPGST